MAWAIVRDYTANNPHDEREYEDRIPVYQRGNQFLVFEGDNNEEPALFETRLEAVKHIYSTMITAKGRVTSHNEFALNDAYPLEVDEPLNWSDSKDILEGEAARIQRAQRPSSRRRRA